jgi:hypothetical protein
MTAFRLISPASRAALLMVAGSALIAAPLLMQLNAAPMVAGMLIGAMAVALGLAGTDSEGRGTLPLSAQAEYDVGLGFGLLAAAGLFWTAGEHEALALFAAAGVTALVTTSITRYTPGRS